jgi:riboflavin kinase / FMN adenylyltransferase
MEVFSDYRKLRLDKSVVTIGSFDGLHRGHQLLLNRVAAWSKELGAQAVVLTFEPHPARYFAPELSPRLIQTTDNKLRAFASLPIDVLLAQRFNDQFALLSPDEFVGSVLVEALAVRGIVVGEDFTFGKGRAGTVTDLQRLAPHHGFAVQIIPRVAADGIAISSTRVRAFLLEGNVKGAALLLGRPFVLTGTIVSGAGRGRKLGFRTANIQTDTEILPAMGVYITWLFWEGNRAGSLSVTNVGVNPTFGSGSLSVEAHALSKVGNLVGKRAALAFLERLRPEKVFSSAKELVAQIRRDVGATKKYGVNHPNTVLHPLDGVDF